MADVVAGDGSVFLQGPRTQYSDVQVSHRQRLEAQSKGLWRERRVLAINEAARNRLLDIDPSCTHRVSTMAAGALTAGTVIRGYPAPAPFETSLTGVPPPRVAMVSDPYVPSAWGVTVPYNYANLWPLTSGRSQMELQAAKLMASAGGDAKSLRTRVAAKLVRQDKQVYVVFNRPFHPLRPYQVSQTPTSTLSPSTSTDRSLPCNSTHR
jgi:hypothetical protein